MRYVTGNQRNFYKSSVMNFDLHNYSKEVAKLEKINTSWVKVCDKLASASFKALTKKQKVRVNQLENAYYSLQSQLKYQKNLVRAMNRKLDDLGRIYPKRASLKFVKLNLLELKTAIKEGENSKLHSMSNSEFANKKQELLYKHTGNKERLETQLASYQDRKLRLTHMQEKAETGNFSGATTEELEVAQKFADKTIKIIEDKLASL